MSCADAVNGGSCPQRAGDGDGIGAAAVTADVSDTVASPRAAVHGIVLTAGSVLRADDAAGPVLARRMEESPVEGWEAIDGGQTPEDDIIAIRRARPAELWLVDAADMALPAGSIRRLSQSDVAAKGMFTTHSMPLTFLISELEEICPELVFIGIQPGTTEFYGPMTPAVRDAVDEVYEAVRDGGDAARFAPLCD